MNKTNLNFDANQIINSLLLELEQSKKKILNLKIKLSTKDLDLINIKKENIVLMMEIENLKTNYINNIVFSQQNLQSNLKSDLESNLKSDLEYNLEHNLYSNTEDIQAIDTIKTIETIETIKTKDSNTIEVISPKTSNIKSEQIINNEIFIMNKITDSILLNKKNKLRKVLDNKDNKDNKETKLNSNFNLNKFITNSIILNQKNKLKTPDINTEHEMQIKSEPKQLTIFEFMTNAIVSKRLPDDSNLNSNPNSNSNSNLNSNTKSEMTDSWI